MCSIFIYFGVACIGLLLGSYIAGMLDETEENEMEWNETERNETKRSGMEQS